jgi:hypothetical protein
MKKISITAAILLLTISSIVLPVFAWGYYAIAQGEGIVWSGASIEAWGSMTMKYKSTDFSGMEKVVLRYPDWQCYSDEWVWEVVDSWERPNGAVVLMCEPATTGPNPGEGWLRVVFKRSGLEVGNRVYAVGGNVVFEGWITELPYSD